MAGKNPKTEAPAAAPKVGKYADILEIVQQAGKEAFESEGDKDAKMAFAVKVIKDAGKAKNITFDLSESTLFQYINKARGELGFSRRRATSGGKSSAPSLEDLKNVRKVVAELGLDATKCLELIGKLKSVGDLDIFEACLNTLVEMEAEAK